MEINPIVSRISIYPVKSLDGISLQKAQIGPGGCLLHDREYAIHDNSARFINGKSNALVHLLRSKFDLENAIISLRHEQETGWKDFHLQKEKTDIDEWLSGFFGMPAFLNRNTKGQFMDIPRIAGLTVVSGASLESVAGWFDMGMEETRKRFRATIEISGVPAFWEDRLFSEEGTAVEFKIRDITIIGMSPRARCVVPTRHPETGEVIHAFPKTFSQHRLAALPPWSRLENYGHSYYLTVNSYIPSSQYEKWIYIGDEVKITGRQVSTGSVH